MAPPAAGIVQAPGVLAAAMLVSIVDPPDDGMRRGRADHGSHATAYSGDHANSVTQAGIQNRDSNGRAMAMPPNGLQSTATESNDLAGGPRRPSAAVSSSGQVMVSFDAWPVPEYRDPPQRYNRAAARGTRSSSAQRLSSGSGNRGRGREDNQANRPSSNGPSPGSRNLQQDWHQQQQKRVKVLDLPPRAWTRDVYESLQGFGTIVRIDMCPEESSAYVIFQPAPDPHVLMKTAYVAGVVVKVESTNRQLPSVPSPVHPGRSYSLLNIFFTDSIGMGTRTKEHAMNVMQSVSAVNKVRMMLLLGDHKELDFQFPCRIRDENRNFRFQIPLSLIDTIYQVHDSCNSQFYLVIPFEKPPRFFMQLKPGEIADTCNPNDRNWTDWVTWCRQTDVVDDEVRKRLEAEPVMIFENDAIIDIGRWTTYRIPLRTSLYQDPKYQEFQKALLDHGVTIEPLSDFAFVEGAESPIWSLLEEEISGTHPHLIPPAKQRSAFNQLATGQINLSFPVRYQLEACLSNGYLKEHNITQDFLRRLASLHTTLAVQILERVTDMQSVHWEPMDIFSDIPKIKAARKIPSYCVLTRSANITPTMIHVATPMVETSNRIIRKHAADAERFIRIRFTDEKTEGPIYCQRDDRSNALFERITRAMNNGIVVGGRYYEFLAFGNSQFREHGAYFYAPTAVKSADDIRKSMGNFDHIRTAAKFGARLGQCFSTTRAIKSINVKIEMIKDIERNSYTFTDGVGRMSPLLAKMAAQELGLQNAFENPPSLFQFRLAGCKGVLALDPDIPGSVVHIRPSQYKFEAQNVGLEIIRASALSVACFNRQLIIILSTLGVPDSVFLRKQQEMVDYLERATKDEHIALDKLQRNIDVNQTSLTMAVMILDGFMKHQDPFMMSLLHLWRAYNIKYLKEKARIIIEQGALLLGCVDETATLRGHYDDPQSREDATKEEKLAALPEIFLQITDNTRKGHYKVIEGVCVLARNPSLHPGDVRVVRAVDIPALHHLKDVVVLPQTGDRDIANMCSGGDLDGDDYIVLWDADILPESINELPMDFTTEKPVQSEAPITVKDMTDFFVSYMKNNTLPQIATAHLAQADYNASGTRSDTCIQLARLHSEAVDYPKSGISAKMTPDLRPRIWPHFQDSKNRPKHKIYKSGKVLGKLFDRVQLVDFKPQYENAFDGRVLHAFDLDEDMIERAQSIKSEYDASLRRLMAKHEIGTEFEAWSVFVLHHNMEARDYTFSEEFGRTIGVLKDQFAEICCNAAGALNRGDYPRLAPFVAAMYVATARQIEEALEKKLGAEHMPLMSFPWIFPRELGKIATNNNISHELATIQQGRVHKYNKKQTTLLVDLEPGTGDIETKQGVTHFGELLMLDFSETVGNGYTGVEPRDTASSA